jgi:hypothetical protein
MTEQNKKDAPFPEKKKELHFLHSLKEIFNNAKGKHISFRSILDSLKYEGLLFLIALVAIPATFPIPTPPGFTAITGLPMCFLTIQLIFRQERIWLPEWLLNKQIQVSTLRAGIEKLEPLMNKLTLLLRPRYKRFTTKKFERIVGVIAFICSVSITLPIIFGNAIPSAAVLIMALGFLYEDGLAVILGAIIGIIGIIISISVVIFAFYFGLAALTKISDKLSL